MAYAALLVLTKEYPSYPDELRQGVADSGVRRENLFITNKVPPDAMGFEATWALLQRFAEEMPGGYADLCMVHWPNTAEQAGTGKVQATDLVLAAKVAAGELRQDSLIAGLTASCLFGYKQSLTNVRRKTSSAHADPEALEEVLQGVGLASLRGIRWKKVVMPARSEWSGLPSSSPRP
eukprot:s9565_g2.t1